MITAQIWNAAKSFATLTAFLVGASALAADCPDFSGSYTYKKSGRLAVVQKDCAQIELKETYIEYGTGDHVNERTFVDQWLLDGVRRTEELDGFGSALVRSTTVDDGILKHTQETWQPRKTAASYFYVTTLKKLDDGSLEMKRALYDAKGGLAEEKVKLWRR